VPNSCSCILKKQERIGINRKKLEKMEEMGRNGKECEVSQKYPKSIPKVSQKYPKSIPKVS
jgi:hypothetical protein